MLATELEVYQRCKSLLQYCNWRNNKKN